MPDQNITENPVKKQNPESKQQREAIRLNKKQWNKNSQDFILKLRAYKKNLNGKSDDKDKQFKLNEKVPQSVVSELSELTSLFHNLADTANKIMEAQSSIAINKDAELYEDVIKVLGSNFFTRQWMHIKTPFVRKENKLYYKQMHIIAGDLFEQIRDLMDLVLQRDPKFFPDIVNVFQNIRSNLDKLNSIIIFLKKQTKKLPIENESVKEEDKIKAIEEENNAIERLIAIQNDIANFTQTDMFGFIKQRKETQYAASEVLHLNEKITILKNKITSSNYRYHRQQAHKVTEDHEEMQLFPVQQEQLNELDRKNISIRIQKLNFEYMKIIKDVAIEYVQSFIETNSSVAEKLNIAHKLIENKKYTSFEELSKEYIELQNLALSINEEAAKRILNNKYDNGVKTEVHEANDMYLSAQASLDKQSDYLTRKIKELGHKILPNKFSLQAVTISKLSQKFDEELDVLFNQIESFDTIDNIEKQYSKMFIIFNEMDTAMSLFKTLARDLLDVAKIKERRLKGK